MASSALSSGGGRLVAVCAQRPGAREPILVHRRIGSPGVESRPTKSPKYPGFCHWIWLCAPYAPAWRGTIIYAQIGGGKVLLKQQNVGVMIDALVAKLVDVDADGRALTVQEGVLRIRYRLGYDRETFMRPSGRPM